MMARPKLLKVEETIGYVFWTYEGTDLFIRLNARWGAFVPKFFVHRIGREEPSLVTRDFDEAERFIQQEIDHARA